VNTILVINIIPTLTSDMLPPIRSKDPFVSDTSSSSSSSVVPDNSNELEENPPRSTFLMVGTALVDGLLDVLGDCVTVGEVLGLNDGDTDG
jgi:hypothetical protein